MLTTQFDVSDQAEGGARLQLANMPMQSGALANEVTSKSGAPKVVDPDAVPILEAFGDRVRPLLTGEDTHNQIFVSVESAPYIGYSVPPHMHTQEDEIFVVQQGLYEFDVGGAVHEASSGTVVYAPRNVPHAWRAVGEEPGHMYVLSVPGGSGRFYQRESEAFNLSRLTGTAPDADALARIAYEHGVILLPSAPDAITRITREIAKHTTPNTLKVVRSGEGLVREFPGERARFMLMSEDTGGTLVLAEIEVDPYCGPPPHMHTREDEIFMIQSGRFKGYVGDRHFEGGPGTVVYGPRNLPHAWYAVGDQPGRVLVAAVPGGFDQFFLRYSQSRSNGEGPERWAEIGAEYGLVFLPPEN